MRNLIVFNILIFAFNLGLKAQQTPLYSQYILNEFIINPAVAGSDGMTTVNISGRKQWWGLGYSPETYSASAATRILKSRSPFIGKRKPGANSIRRGASGRVGLGASLIRDKNGAVSSTTLNLSYAYNIPFFQSDLALGISLLTTQFRIDDELAQFADPDPATALLGVSTYTPDAAFGADYSTEKYHIGFSVFNLFQSPVKFGSTQLAPDQLDRERIYYILGTYRDNLPSIKNWEYEGAIIARGTENIKGTVELTARFIYFEEYWFGFSYRSSKDIIGMLGLKLNRFYFGYSFDYGFNDLARVSYGSHEIVMAIKFGDSTRRYRYWIRY